jgi:hypothetical protein
MEEETNYEWSKEVEERNKASKELFTHCAPRCPRCQGTLQTMEVHGHEQCVLCHAVIEDCCQGAQLK